GFDRPVLGSSETDRNRCAVHVRQLRGESPRPNLMEVKGVAKRKGEISSRGGARKKRGANARADGQEPNRGETGRTRGPVTPKSISIKGTSRRFGGCAWKAVELTAGGLWRVSEGTGGAERLLIGAQESAEGGVGAGRRSARPGQRPEGG